MERQAALNLIWKRLLLVFVLLLTTSIFLAQAEGLEKYRVPFLVFIAGNIGGYVGLHRRLADLNNQEIQNLAISLYGIILPSFIGGILACVMYTLFISGIIDGDLFPTIAPDETCQINNFERIFCQHAVGHQSYAKLLFWSFVAGFNQKYVVDIIDSIKGEKSLNRGDRLEH